MPHRPQPSFFVLIDFTYNNLNRPLVSLNLSQVIVSGTFRARNGMTAEMKTAMEAVLTASQAEDGCIVYTYAVDVQDPTIIRVFEIWRDAEALAAHRKAPHLPIWRNSWATIGIDNPQLQIHEITATRAF
jgi:quinol monooxygenase YgiN